ncbi:MAG: ribose 5-phosphate isomerase B [Syntrophomonadaceae bacterium]|jgi:RpiB/LacA/LacB family sugar-phosphate isomerase|nr:ribose 5-phosphate isomerase B [Syntrophomonadaceae bacterium]
MQIIIGSDHAGYELKKDIKRLLEKKGWLVKDAGAHSPEPVDYPDIAEIVAREVLSSEDTLGILVCGTGMGMAIAANKVPGIRAAVCTSVYAASMAREHNDANILSIGARVTDAGLAGEIVKTFLQTPFQGGRHARRVDKIKALESRFHR